MFTAAWFVTFSVLQKSPLFSVVDKAENLPSELLRPGVNENKVPKTVGNSKKENAEYF